MANFKISHIPSESFRFFRLRQTEKNSGNYFEMKIKSLEIFGTLHEMEKVKRPKLCQREFVYHADREGLSPPPLFPPKLDGLIAALTLECGGNVHDNGIVNAIADYSYQWDGKARYALEFRKWCVPREDKNASRICLDFKDRTVTPTGYSVDSRHLTSLVVEVSNDGYMWTEIDRHNDLTDARQIAHFDISHVQRGRFKFFRLRATEDNCSDSKKVQIKSLEVFGTLYGKVDRPKPQQREFAYRADREGQAPPPLFNPKIGGMIAYLSLECSGNVYDKGIVNVIASSSVGPFPYMACDAYRLPYMACNARKALDLGCDSEYCSNDEKYSWICYDFKDRRIIPTSYSVKSRQCLMSWAIEVSNDGYCWREIDHRNNIEDLKAGELVNFKISHIPSESFRFFRLKQTGTNHCGDYHLKVCSLEIFGTLYEVERPKDKQTEFVYHADKLGLDPPPLFPAKFDGVIKYLTLECDGNIHYDGFAAIEEVVNMMGCPGPVSFLFVSSSQYTFIVGDSWVCYDFKWRRVIPTGYSVNTGEWKAKNPDLTWWVSEVSNDGLSWIEVDRTKSSTLRELPHCGISHVPSDSFRFFRVRQVGSETEPMQSDERKSLEIFGTLHEMEKVERPKPCQREFVYHKDREELSPPPLFPPNLDGVITALTLECGGNVHDNGIVNVTASSFAICCESDGDMLYYPKEAANFGVDFPYQSEPKEDSWICFDFKDRSLIPTGYSLDSHFLKSWVIEVSNNGDSWREIDRRTEFERPLDLERRFKADYFKISQFCRDSFRFVRLRQTGPNNLKKTDFICKMLERQRCGNARFILEINALEFFGTLCEK